MNQSVATPAPSTALDVPAVRAEFPALAQEVNGHPLAYLDNAASAQKPSAVIDAVSRLYGHDYANVHRGIHELSRRSTEAYEGARGAIARFLGISDTAELILTSGTTMGLNVVASTWGTANLREGDEILLSIMEHHSNLVPWQMLATRTGATVRYLDVDDEGRYSVDDARAMIGERTRLVALSHVSNALGTINPVREIGALARDAGALMVVDGAQSVPHAPVDVPSLGCDFFAFSGHKMYGPSGVGGLWGRRELLDAMPPFLGGGDMIDTVALDGSTWAALPHKFEAGTPNIAGVVGLGAAVEYLDRVGMDAVASHEAALMTYALEHVRAVPGIIVYGPSDPAARAGVISFTLADVHPHDLSTILDSEGVAIRAGHHCCQPLMRRLGVAATARASFGLYNTFDEVDRLVDALHSSLRLFGY
jgi:cysteine desulfurase / selenocysteine lyase